jgi:hypothetical protein
MLLTVVTADLRAVSETFCAKLEEVHSLLTAITTSLSICPLSDADNSPAINWLPFS